MRPIPRLTEGVRLQSKQAAEEQVALRAGLPPRRITSNTVIELFARPARVENVEMRELSLEERDGLSSAGSGSLEVPCLSVYISVRT